MYRTINFITVESKTLCKGREITLNYLASPLVYFEKMKNKILSMDADETVIVRTRNKIKRNGVKRRSKYYKSTRGKDLEGIFSEAKVIQR
jgi:ribosomal 50S subunit-associated protein YjgA (DUF615 family)